MDNRINEVLSSHKESGNELIPILQHVQEAFGYLPREAMSAIAAHAKIPPSKVYGVATFYTMFRFTPLGRKHVCLCRGTACHVRGADQIREHVERHLGIKEGETTPDGEYSLETVACMGCCALAPCLNINSEVHGRLTPGKVSRILPKSTGSREKNNDSEQ